MQMLPPDGQGLLRLACLECANGRDTYEVFTKVQKLDFARHLTFAGLRQDDLLQKRVATLLPLEILGALGLDRIIELGKSERRRHSRR